MVFFVHGMLSFVCTKFHLQGQAGKQPATCMHHVELLG